MAELVEGFPREESRLALPMVGASLAPMARGCLLDNSGPA
jgi:hypothetical protein